MQVGQLPTATSAGLTGAEASGTTSADWPVRKYFLVMAGLAVPAMLFLVLGYLIGEPWVGAVLSGALFGALILMRPEVGLYLLVLFYPFENFALIGETSITKVLGLFTFVSLLINAFSTRPLQIWVGPFWLALGFALWSVLGVFVAESGELAVSALFTRFQMVGLLFVTISLCATRERAETLFWFMFVSAFVASCAGFFLAPEAEQVWQVRRLTLAGHGMNVGADRFAKEIIPALFLAPFLLTRTARRYWPVVLIGAGVVVVALVESYARAVAAGCLVGLAVMLLCYREWPLRRRVALAVLAISLVVGIVALGPATGLYGEGISAKILEIQTKGLETGGRATLWKVAVRAGVEHPILGIGIGNIPLYSLRYAHGDIRVSHNDLLTHFAETGVPGIVLYLAFLVAVFRNVWRTGVPWLRVGMIGIFIAQILSSMANPSYMVKGFWLQMGVILLVSRAFPEGGVSSQEAVASVPETGGRIGIGTLPAAPSSVPR